MPDPPASAVTHPPSTPAGPLARYLRERGFVFSPAPIPRYRRRVSHGAWKTAAAWIAAAVSTPVIIGALVADGIFIAALPEIDLDTRRAALAITIATAAGAGSLLLLFAFARTYAKVAVAVLSVVLLTGGLGLFCAAPVVRQMNVAHLAEYRGFAAYTWFGAAATALGVACGLFALRWSMDRRARRWLARWARLLGSAYGIVLALSGLGLMLALLSLVNGDASQDEFGNDVSVIEQAIAFTAIAMWSLAPGLILTYHGISASMGEGSSDFRPPVPALVALAFGVVLLAGHADMSRESPVALPMPLLHVLAGALPGVGYVALAARGHPLRGAPLSGVTGRQVTLAAAISMAVATMIAIYVESFGALYAVILLLVHNGAFETAANAGDAFDRIGDADFILTDNEQFVAGLVTAAVLAPLAEEFAKALSARFMFTPLTTRAQAFLLGACAGAGFGFLESLLYGLAGIGEEYGGLGGWWLIMLVRGGSTSLHVLCAGLGALAFWHWSRTRRHRLAAALFATAVLIHAGWNGVFTVIEQRIFGLDTLEDRTIEIIAYAIVAAVSAAMIAAIPLISRRLRDHPAPLPPDIHALPVWLG